MVIVCIFLPLIWFMGKSYEYRLPSIHPLNKLGNLWECGVLSWGHKVCCKCIIFLLGGVQNTLNLGKSLHREFFIPLVFSIRKPHISTGPQTCFGVQAKRAHQISFWDGALGNFPRFSKSVYHKYMLPLPKTPASPRGSKLAEGGGEGGGGKGAV